MDKDRSSSGPKIGPVKLEPVEFVLCDESAEQERHFPCQIDHSYEEGNRRIEEETKWDIDVTREEITNSGKHSDSLALSRIPLVNETNDQDPFAEVGSEEGPEARTILEQEIMFNRDQVKGSAGIFNAILSCLSQSKKEEIKSKEINLDIPQNPISAFFKGERTFKIYDDQKSEIVKHPKPSEQLSKSSYRFIEGLGRVPVLLLNPKNRRDHSIGESTWNEQLIENIDEKSLSSSSSASLGYDSGSEDLSYQEQKTNIYCPTCNKAFPDKASFNNHSEAYHGRRIKCDHCNRSFRSEKKLKMHKENLRRCHEFIRSGKLFNDRVSSGLNEKFQSNENFSKVSLRLVPTHKLLNGTDDLNCNEDNKALIDEQPADAKVDSLDGSSTDGFPKRVGTDSDLILNDENSFGPEESTNVCCKICRNVFTNKSDLKIHFLTHTERKYCKCNHCDKYFKSEKELNTHTENLLTSHVFLKSGQVSYVSFYGEPFYHREEYCAQETIDEGDIKPIIVQDEEDDIPTLHCS